MRIIQYLYNQQDDNMKYPTMIAKYTGYFHTSVQMNIDVFQKKGYVTSNYEGRRRYLKLTVEGEQLAVSVNEILNRMGE